MKQELLNKISQLSFKDRKTLFDTKVSHDSSWISEG